MFAPASSIIPFTPVTVLLAEATSVLTSLTVVLSCVSVEFRLPRSLNMPGVRQIKTAVNARNKSTLPTAEIFACFACFFSAMAMSPSASTTSSRRPAMPAMSSCVTPLNAAPCERPACGDGCGTGCGVGFMDAEEAVLPPASVAPVPFPVTGSPEFGFC